MIAMALACRPDILIADEPTTALDVTVQAQIIALLRELQAERGTAILLITHDIGAVAEMADRVMVMYAGRVVEQGSAERVLGGARHPYTRALIECLPELGASGRDERAELPEIAGVVPSIWDLGSGCAFRDRCPQALPRCAGEVPPMLDMGGGHRVACWLEAQPLRRGEEQPAQRAILGELSNDRLLSVADLKVHFPRRRRGWWQPQEVVKAVDGVSFDIARGQTLALSVNRVPARRRRRWPPCAWRR